MPSATKQVFQTVTGTTSDPSLKIKAEYAQQAIKKIGNEDNAYTDAIEEGLLTIAN